VAESDDNDLRFGVDGWPRGGPDAEMTARIEEVRFKRDMEAALERWRGGDPVAGADMMLLYWRRYPERLPRFFVEVVEALAERARAEDERRAEREFRVARIRWEELTELHERRHELARAGDHRGMTMKAAREAVSKALRGTEARGAAGAIKYSYDLIEAAGGEHATPQSYQQELRRREEKKLRRRFG
jgi:hypothetical protein